MANQKPVDEIRIGRVKATIWRNGTEEQPRYNVTFSRLYKDGDQWKSTQSFGRNDLLVLAKVADLAHTRIFALPQEEQTSHSERGARRGSAPPRSELFPFHTLTLLDSQGSLQSRAWESSSATARLLRGAFSGLPLKRYRRVRAPKHRLRQTGYPSPRGVCHLR